MTRNSILEYSIFASCFCLIGCAAPRMTFEANSDQPSSPTVGLHFERPPEDEPNAQQAAEDGKTPGSLDPFGEHKRIPLRRTDQADEGKPNSSLPAAPMTTASETAPFSF